MLALSAWLGVLLPDAAHADIYLQEDMQEEIHLSNLVDMPAENTAVDDDHATRYILLVQDESTAGVPQNKVAPIYAKLPFADAVAMAAQQTSLDPALLHAVISIESNNNPKALSHRGARGLMQLMPGTAKRFNVSNPDDPRQNVLAGAQYLRELRGLFHGDLQLMLAAYNAGPGAVIKHGTKIPPFAETQTYVPKVLRYYQKIGASYQLNTYRD
ncbi:MAG: lytic transglycosylase domain-containing protein [Candidatus Methylopumilus sp.]